jgi:hypothetical protein
MEEELKISYTTLRSRFNELLQSMGFEAEEEAVVKLSLEDCKKILGELNKGCISAEEAQIRLKGAAKITKK